MNYIEEQQKRLMAEQLQSNNELSQKDIQDIVYSLQVSSGNSIGVGKVKGILKYLEQSPLKIMGKQINDKYELANLIHSIDPYIDIKTDRDFKGCF